jgi:hypothetical protein
VKLKAGDEGAACGHSPTGPGKHPRGEARTVSGTLVLFLVFGSNLETPTLASGEDRF